MLSTAGAASQAFDRCRCAHKLDPRSPACSFTGMPSGKGAVRALGRCCRLATAGAQDSQPADTQHDQHDVAAEQQASATRGAWSQAMPGAWNSSRGRARRKKNAFAAVRPAASRSRGNIPSWPQRHACPVESRTQAAIADHRRGALVGSWRSISAYTSRTARPAPARGSRAEICASTSIASRSLAAPMLPPMQRFSCNPWR